MAFIGRALLSLPLDDLAPEFLRYLDERRRPNGSYNNTPATDGSDNGGMADTHADRVPSPSPAAVPAQRGVQAMWREQNGVKTRVF